MVYCQGCVVGGAGGGGGALFCFGLLIVCLFDCIIICLVVSFVAELMAWQWFIMRVGCWGC